MDENEEENGAGWLKKIHEWRMVQEMLRGFKAGFHFFGKPISFVAGIVAAPFSWAASKFKPEPEHDAGQQSLPPSNLIDSAGGTIEDFHRQQRSFASYADTALKAAIVFIPPVGLLYAAYHFFGLNKYSKAENARRMEAALAAQRAELEEKSRHDLARQAEELQRQSKAALAEKQAELDAAQNRIEELARPEQDRKMVDAEKIRGIRKKVELREAANIVSFRNDFSHLGPEVVEGLVRQVYGEKYPRSQP